MPQQQQPDLQRLPPKPLKLNRVPKISICSFRLETEFNCDLTIGVDEVGRGCLAGPVVVAGVIFSKTTWAETCAELTAITDSKMIRQAKREELSDYILKTALAVEIGICSPQIIDRINILQATFQAARDVLKKIERKLGCAPEIALIDGPHPIPKVSIRQHTVIGGDGVSKSIAAASIVAKVYRDRLMCEAAKEFPGYGFETNVGYGTEAHIIALKKLGPTGIHRQSFLKNFQNLETGRKGEESAKEFLVDLNFNILSQNWKTPGAEIDLVAEKDGELRFVEVRTRTSNVKDVQFFFAGAKQKQFQKAVELYRLKNPASRNKNYHLDLLCITPDGIEPYWDVFKF
jgi:ribonuclease HII